MTWDANRGKSGPKALRIQSGEVFASADMAGQILNMAATPSGTLRTVVGPASYLPTTSRPPFFTKPGGGRGVCHALLRGGTEDVTLVDADGQIRRVHEIHAEGALGGVASGYTASDFLTQFVPTPQGIIILQQGRRPLFYDGEILGHLGYERAPAAPMARGPLTMGGRAGYANDAGYAHCTAYLNYTIGPRANPILGAFRLGTVDTGVISDGQDSTTGTTSNTLGGILREGEWRSAVQWIDRWGNVSPLSGRSQAITIQKEDNLQKARRMKDFNERAVTMRLQGLWTNIPVGPDHTVGRILCRTRDLRQSGDPDLYEIPNDAMGGSGSFANIPDNETQVYPDNVPDAWLIAKPLDAMPVPNAKIGALAFGRLWLGNYGGTRAGAVAYSVPGRFGTFERNAEIFPDQKGEELTALLPTEFGLLTFTRSSTFVIEQNTGGDGFRVRALSSSVGCVSPDSARVLPSGEAMWLGEGGFFRLTREGMMPASEAIKDGPLRRMFRSMAHRVPAVVDPRTGEYRAWLPLSPPEATLRTLCVVYDGTGWREREDIRAFSACVTRDHRGLVLVQGNATAQYLPSVLLGDTYGVWVMDRVTPSGGWQISDRTASIESAWFATGVPGRKSTILRVLVWLRETSATPTNTLTVEVMRDWRDVVVETHVLRRYAEADVPLSYGNGFEDAGTLDELRGVVAPAVWRRRRLFWTHVDVHLPATDALKLRLSGQGDWEFIGVSFEDLETTAGQRKGQRGE